MTTLRSGSATDVGRRRPVNQDTVLDGGDVFAVADGMGGHQGGEVASLVAIEAFRDAFRRNPTVEGLVLAVEEANAAVARRAEASAELRNMGTTLTALALVSGGEDDLLVVANIGDSRAYLLRDRELSQLTEDHSVTEELLRQGQLTRDEADVDPRRHILTRVLGASFGDGPDTQNLIPYVGDRFLLCSDGLYNEVPDADVASVLRTVADPAEAARRLVEQANAHGGGDNITVLIVDVVDDDGRAEDASEALAQQRDPDDTPLVPSPVDGSALRTSALMSADERNAELRELSRGSAAGAGPVTQGWGSGSTPDEHLAPRRRVTGRVVGFVLVLSLLIAGAMAVVGFSARGAYFVGLDEGRVAIFKGRPGGFLWFSPTVEETTDLTEASIPQARADDVEAGFPVATMAEARRYVANLRAAGTVPAPTVVPATTAVPATVAPVVTAATRG